MQVNLSSLADPSYKANLHLPVAVIADGNPENLLKAKYFLPQIQQQFTRLGYKNVYLATEKTAPTEGLLVKVHVSTEKRVINTLQLIMVTAMLSLFNTAIQMLTIKLHVIQPIDLYTGL